MEGPSFLKPTASSTAKVRMSEREAREAMSTLTQRLQSARRSAAKVRSSGGAARLISTPSTPHALDSAKRRSHDARGWLEIHDLRTE